MNDVRTRLEDLEYELLSPYAAKSREAVRDVDEEPSDIRTAYQRDRDRILHSKAFRRLKHKTQVFLAPEGDHYRTRLSHTLEVAQIARTIARALRMNEDLTEAIALGHDIGHTAFGHAGEDILNEVCKEGFSHYEQGLRVVEHLEKDGAGLNLTKQVRDGMLNHRMIRMPATVEGRIVRISDKIAYINHDIDDAIRAGILSEDMLPHEYTKVLGNNVHDRLNTMIHDVIEASADSTEIVLSEPRMTALLGLREFMFSYLYKGSIAKQEDEKAKNVLKMLYEHYLDNIELLPEEYLDQVWLHGESWDRVACDYVSGMTDDYAIHRFKELFVPAAWKY